MDPDELATCAWVTSVTLTWGWSLEYAQATASLLPLFLPTAPISIQLWLLWNALPVSMSAAEDMYGVSPKRVLSLSM